MDTRDEDLTKLQSYVDGIDKELTMLLQNLQWDRKQLLEGSTMVTCGYNSNHRVPPDKKEIHEKECFLKSQGFTKEDKMLPDPFDTDSTTLVRLSNTDINEIITKAALMDPSFKRGPGCRDTTLSLECLQTAYSASERRAIHEAVVAAAPARHDLTDLALISEASSAQKGGSTKSRLEILAELRDLKRRRVKYRGAKTRNYSDVLRDVIATQMELYSEPQVKQEPPDVHANNDSEQIESNQDSNFNRNPRNSRRLDDARHQSHDRRDRSGEWHRETAVRNRPRYVDVSREGRTKYSTSSNRNVDDYNNRQFSERHRDTSADINRRIQRDVSRELRAKCSSSSYRCVDDGNRSNTYGRNSNSDSGKRRKDYIKEEKDSDSEDKEKIRRKIEYDTSSERDSHRKYRRIRQEENETRHERDHESSPRDRSRHRERDNGRKNERYVDRRSRSERSGSSKREEHRRYYDTVRVKEEPQDF